ncbi:hypothetical protein [Streptomyces sp. T028]|uniref:hypothetical protein n=1 Tax=Streptomyces sp. T028 TaxID=3394379 RepID=UPI003A87F0A3
MNGRQGWATVVVFVGACGLIISEEIHRVAVVLGGAGSCRATDDRSAYRSEHSGSTGTSAS